MWGDGVWRREQRCALTLPSCRVGTWYRACVRARRRWFERNGRVFKGGNLLGQRLVRFFSADSLLCYVHARCLLRR